MPTQKLGDFHRDDWFEPYFSGLDWSLDVAGIFNWLLIGLPTEISIFLTEISTTMFVNVQIDMQFDPIQTHLVQFIETFDISETLAHAIQVYIQSEFLNIICDKKATFGEN